MRRSSSGTAWGLPAARSRRSITAAVWISQARTSGKYRSKTCCELNIGGSFTGARKLGVAGIIVRARWIAANDGGGGHEATRLGDFPLTIARCEDTLVPIISPPTAVSGEREDQGGTNWSRVDMKNRRGENGRRADSARREGTVHSTNADATEREPTFEPLEPRQLLSADLVVGVAPLRFSNTDPGVNQVIDMSVGNVGNSLSGPSQVDLFAVAEGQAFDPDTATHLRTQLFGTLIPPRNVPFSLSVTIPPTLTPGNYRIVAMVDGNNRVTESDETNNTFEAGTFTVNQLDFDLQNEVAGASRNLTDMVVAGTPKRAAIFVRIGNSASSTSRAPRAAYIPVIACARPVDATDDSQDVMLNLQPVYVNASKFAPGRSGFVKVPIVFPPGLDEGDYTIVVKVDPDNTLQDTDETNTESMLEGMVISVDDPFVDLQADITSAVNLPSSVVSGDGTRLRVPVLITNHGNVPTYRAQRVNVTVTAVAVSGGATQVVGTFNSVPVGNFAPGRGRVYNFDVTLPPGVVDGTYKLQVHVDYDNLLDEPDEENNIDTTSQMVAVAEGFVDLSPAIVGTPIIPSSVVAGNGAPVRIPVEITNNGNVAIPAGQTIVTRISVQDTGGGPLFLVDTFAGVNVGGVLPGQSRVFTFNTTLPVSVPEGEFRYIIEIDSTDVLDESNEGNNTTQSSQTTGVAEGFYDLVAAFNTNLNLPNAVVAGDGTNLTLPIVITNNGNLRTPNNTYISVEISAVDGGTTVIDTIDNVNVSGMNPGQARAFNLFTSLPVNLPEDTYNLRVFIDSGDDLDESDDTTNNTITTSQSIVVAEGFVDIVPSVVANTLPPAVVSGAGSAGVITVDVRNEGNVRMPVGQLVDIVVCLRPVGGGNDVEIGRYNNRSISYVAPNGVVRTNVNVTVPGGLGDGDYTTVVKVNPSSSTPLTEDTGNNEATSSNINVAEGFNDLTVAFGANLNLPSAVVAGDGTAVTLPIVITNNGNLRTPNNTLVSVNVSAIDGGITDLGTIAGFNVGGLNPGQSRAFNVNTTLPVNLPEDIYNLRVFIDSTDTFDESDDTTNNMATTSQTINVAEGFVDFVPSVFSNTLPPAVVSGAGTSGVLTVDVKNEGNVRMPVGQLVDIVVCLRPVGGGNDVEIGRYNSRSISNLVPNGTVRTNVNVAVPGGLGDGDYTTVVKVFASDNTPLVQDEGNDEVTDDNIMVAEGFNDLLLAFGATLNLPSAVVAGDGTGISVPIVVTNNGNLRTPNNTLVDAQVSAVDGGVTVIGTITGLNVGGLNPGQSRAFTLNTTLPVNLPEDVYQIRVFVDSADTFEESDDTTNNTVTSTQQINVAEGFVDIVPSVFSNTLPPAVVSGAGTSGVVVVDVENEGNVRMPVGQLVDIVVCLRPVGGGNDVEIGRVNNRSISNIVPGGIVRTNVNVSVPGGVGDGDYTTVVKVNPSSTTPLTEDTGNNEATSSTITVAAGFNDLVASFAANFNPPANLISGAGTNLAVPVVVTNNGNLRTPNNTIISIELDGVGMSTEGGEIGTFGGFNVGALNPGQSKTFTINTTIPIEAETDTYNILAFVDSLDVFEESDDVANNKVTSTQTINVTQGFRDLEPISLSDNLNASLVAGSAQSSGTVNLSVRNNGNLPIPAGTTVDLIVTLEPIGGGQDFEIGRVSNTSISNLGAGASIAKAVNVMVNANVPENDYAITVTVQLSASTPLTESDVMNNSGTSGNVSVDPAMNDIRPVNFAENLAPNIVAGATGTATLNINNNGNVPAPAGLLVDITVALRPTGGGSDIVIGTINNLNIGNLGVGANSAQQTVNLTVPGNTPEDTYDFVVTVTPDSTTPLTEVDTANNEGQVAGVVVAAPFIDVSLLTAGTLYGTMPTGSTASTGSVTIANGGNVAATGTVNVQFYFTVSGNIATDGQLIGSQNGVTLNVAAGNIQTINNVSLVLPNPAEQTTGSIIARIVPMGLSPADNDTDDYEVTTNSLTIVPIPPFVGDVIGTLSFDTETLYLPTNVPPFGLITASAQGQANSNTNYNTGYQYNVNYQTLQKQAIINLFADNTIDGGHTIAPQWILTLNFTNNGVRPDHIVGHTIRIVETNQAGVDGTASISGLLLDGAAYPDSTFFFMLD
ncbi:MAG: LEPR-XLL domain-containing protein [Phycisphaera sp.]|nr:LEPR-XLL domain-containing protein [Phycisphaera sp.]